MRKTGFYTSVFLFPRIGIGFHSCFDITVKPRLLHRTENAVAKSLIVAFQLSKKLFHRFSFRCTVRGAFAFHDGKCGIGGKITDVLFRCINERTNHSNIRAVEIGDGGEATESALVKKVEHKGLDSVIEMMSECDLITAELFRRIVDHTASELGAKRARIGFLAHVENDLCNIGGLDVIRDVQAFAKLADRRIIGGNTSLVQIAEAHIDGHGNDLKLFRIKAAKLRQRIKKRKRILAGGNTHGDLIAVLDHVIIVSGASCIA